jgi:type IV secretory pathway VirB4 component
MLRVPLHEATTRHLASLYPWQAQPGLPPTGTLVGIDVLSSQPFTFDPFELYGGAIKSPCMLVLGAKGYGKSAATKSWLYREVGIAGRRVFILDPKGEYRALCDRLGIPVLRLVPSGAERLNPLDPASGAGGQVLDRQRVQLLAALAAAGLGRDTTPEERRALSEAVRRLDHAPVLADVTAMLHDPPAEMVTGMRVPPEGKAALVGRLRDMTLALDELVEGSLRGMFDGRSTCAIDWYGRGVCLDLSAVYGRPEFVAVMVAAASYLASAINPERPVPTILVLDECWAVLREPQMVRWLSALVKMARALGVCVVLISQFLSDLHAVGGPGSEQRQLATNLLSDCETRIFFRQPTDQLPAMRDLLALTEPECEVIPELARGRSLWIVGEEHRAVVDHLLTDYELEQFASTDAAMRSVSAR